MPKITESGEYLGKVKSSEFGEAGTGTPFLNLYLESDGGDTIGAFLYLSEGAFANTVKTLREVFDFNGKFEALSEQVDGKPVRFTVEMDEYNGTERPKVKWINHPDRKPGIGKPIDNKDAFLKTLSVKASRIPVEAPKAPAPTKAPAPKPAAKKPAAPFDGEESGNPY